MKKKILIFNCITLMLFCQVLAPNATALTDKQSEAIENNCLAIKDKLRKVQKDDSKTRVYLGGYYEVILDKFITPLNIRLVENNLSTSGLIENQNDFASAKALFIDDFVTYQKNLEELVGVDCRAEPEKFYEDLKIVREKRKIMVQDVLKIRSLISSHIRLVEGLKGKF